MTAPFWSPHPGLVGLDVGSSAIKVVQLGGWPRSTARAVVLQSIPHGRVVDGVVADREALTADLRRLWLARRLSGRRVAIALSGSSICVKRLRLPPMSRDEVRGAVEWEASQHLPAPLDQMALDYALLDGRRAHGTPFRWGRDRGSPGPLDVLIVAVRRDRLAAWIDVVERARLQLRAVDHDALALQRAWELSRLRPTGVESIALMNVGASCTNINIVGDNGPLFLRDVPTGGDLWTDATERLAGVSRDDAEQLKRAWRANSADGHDGRLTGALRDATEQWMHEVAQTFDYARASLATRPVDRVVLAGGGATLDGLAEALSRRLGVPVTTLMPFTPPQVEGDAAAVASACAVAFGLAARGRRRWWSM